MVRSARARPRHRAAPGSLPLVVVLSAVLGIAAACSRVPDADRTARDVTMRFETAIHDQHWDQACGLLAPSTRDEVAQNAGSSCARGLSAADVPSGGAVRDVEVWGLAGQVRLAGDVLFLTTVDAHWAVTAAGCRSQGDAPYQCAVKGG